MTYKKALHIFRRDLRVEDNTALIEAMDKSEKVITAFIFTQEQIDENPYLGEHSLQFMLDSLKDLEEEIEKRGGTLYFFYGEPHKVVEECIQKLNVAALFLNRDYTPYSIARDKKILSVCKKEKVDFYSFDDALLNPPETVLKPDKKPYTVFTPFFKKALQEKVLSPRQNKKKNFFSSKIDFSKSSSIFKEILPKRPSTLLLKGGRKEALKILKNIKDFSKYAKERDFPYLDATTHLSPYLKFTAVSPREAYYEIRKAFKKEHDLIRELYWRDFFTSIAFFFPHVFEGAFHKKYDALKWSSSTKDFTLWCEGKTGFPIVDAAMRELNLTGNMHGRSRMIVASFLTKDLHIDWQKGEKYFAQKLTDYDPSVNNGNWQWVAGTGCDAQPYFRIFNPWLQQQKFDPECKYIKKWIPELKNVSIKAIHNWFDEKHQENTTYPLPMLDHKTEAAQTLKMYKKNA